jgi:hypothetical protein
MAAVGVTGGYCIHNYEFSIMASVGAVKSRIIARTSCQITLSEQVATSMGVIFVAVDCAARRVAFR